MMQDPNAPTRESNAYQSASPELTMPTSYVEFSSTQILSGKSRTGVTTVVFTPDDSLCAADILGNFLHYELDPKTGLADSTTLVASVVQSITGHTVDPTSTADSITHGFSSYQIYDEACWSKISNVDRAKVDAAQVTDVITCLWSGGHDVKELGFGLDSQHYIAADGLASLGAFSSGVFGFVETLRSAVTLTAILLAIPPLRADQSALNQ